MCLSISGFKAASFIGGRDIAEDRKAISGCRAVVGTPGRLLHLISNNVLCMDNIRLFVLDEADKLLQGNFQSDVKKLIRNLKTSKVQMLASSATFSDETNKILMALMKNPIGVTPSRDAPILLGVKQCTYTMDDDEEWKTADKHAISIRAMVAKVDAIKAIFARIAFKQAIIFSNSQMRAESYCKYLQQAGWKVDVISGSHEQSARLATFQRFKSFETRILVATDLMARGIDVENINLVINLDVPAESATYLHRIGRCGRFGSRGTAITIVGNVHESMKFKKMLKEIGGGDQLNVLEFRTENGVVSEVSKETEGTEDANESVANGHATEVVNEPKTEMKNEPTAQTPTQNGSKIKKFSRNSLDVQTKNLQLLELTQLMIGPVNGSGQADLKSDLFESFVNCTDGVTAHQQSDANGNANEHDTLEIDQNLFGSYHMHKEVTTRTYHAKQNGKKMNELEENNDVFDDQEEDLNDQGDDDSLESSSSECSDSSCSSDADDDASPLPNDHQPYLEALKKLNIDDLQRRSSYSTSSSSQSSDSEDSDNSQIADIGTQKYHRCKNHEKRPSAQQSPPADTESFANWSAIYWNQVNHINQYVNFVRQQQHYAKTCYQNN